MDNTESKFDGQAIAKTNLEKRPKWPQKGACPGVFGAVRWLSWISRTKPHLSERSRMVTLLIVELSARNDQAFPSLRWLATHIGCSPSSVRLAIREAEQSGLVRRGERFDHREFSGGRQTSNCYEIVLHPGLELQEGLGLEKDRELVIVDDESDPNQLELQVGAERVEPAHAATRPSLANVRPRVSAPTTTPVQVEANRGPLADQEGPPSHPAQGVKDLRERTQEKAASTRAPACDREPSERAAAFLGEVLSEESSREFKMRFGHAAFASLVFAVQRGECREHVAVVKRALERLRVADGVSNPGGYFMRVFRDELEAARLVGQPTVEELCAETERHERAALRQRARELNARLEQVRCIDLAEADRIRSRLDALYAELRMGSQTMAARASGKCAASRAQEAVHAPEVRAAARAEELAAAAEALDFVRRGFKAGEVTRAA
jgi:hypothetical protein